MLSDTRRQQIADALRAGPMTALEISHRFGIPVRTAITDIEHIRRSVRARSDAKFQVHPSQCSSCGFRFRDRTRLTSPSRCPRCRSERISEPSFTIAM